MVDGEIITIYFVLLGLPGDNLGVNSLLGYPESFTTDFCCRFCRVSKYLYHRLTKEVPMYLREKDNYKLDLKTKSHGVLKSCVFDVLPAFCHLDNPTNDPMHDLYLGVCRYDLAYFIDYLIT